MDRAGEVQPFAYARFDRLWYRQAGESLPEWAGGHALFAIAYVETESGAPEAIQHIDFIRVKVDDGGRFGEKEMRRSMGLAASSVDWGWLGILPKHSAVVRAEHVFAKRQHDRDFKWKPSQAQRRQIEALAMRKRRSRRSGDV